MAEPALSDAADAPATLVGGSIPTPLKNDGLKVSWDDDFTQLNGKIDKNVPNHQPVNTYSY